MPTFREMQQLYANIGTIGQQIKKQSDDAMEATWNNSIASILINQGVLMQ